ncbi:MULTISPECIES: HPr family phosphocarrier protein [Acidithiobacillus]|uniref:Phosphocarrier protein HPr n=2 Tax=Acidithiobacillus thiooxidans TaxID=930 RepID=A0A1C2IBJ0_ACITH|nr:MULTISPECIES: HPr family phosphocarrier protein [Acidithiobacillus]MBE7565290.1 HPr family phosphocarrier protein [Acidithiobacillus sp. HP-11]MBU2741795.1 HPr family phosphocarrier protein [Acidithiobacillus albertensis]MBU2752913.1 HPr family phosphocarrier protein [Acidithiobacillus thiooxidans]MBU2793547.1 HPr family phosphocarrier protein [Acidithiobacillus thiooxidans]MBU2837275.1 HPr family phosphocarrier protein [Acidithiobacillus thiooxidans]
MTVRVDYPIINSLGLHARPSAKFVSLSARYPCAVWLERDAQRVNGKSIMGLMTLAAAQGTILTLETEGEGEQACADALLALAKDRFGEDA